MAYALDELAPEPPLDPPILAGTPSLGTGLVPESRHSKAARTSAEVEASALPNVGASAAWANAEESVRAYYKLKFYNN